MSDCFDHEADAWHDCLFGATAQGYAPSSRCGDRGGHVSRPYCRRCGCADVWWHDTAKGWLLMEGAKAHSCPVDTDDFPSA